MKKFLLPESGSFYKANLHCHTTISDGKASPEEVKALYKKHGYSVVAFTDHNVQIPHPELRDADFLPLTGVEYNINAEGYPGKNREVKTCHLCLVAMNDDIKYQVCYTDSYVKHGGARNFIPQSMINPDEPDFERVYTPECVNKMIAAGRAAGYFVTYNHPTWAQQDYTDYMSYHGMHAMEIFNTSCASMGFDEYNSRVYDDMLNGGERIYCVAADDNHNKHPDGDPLSDAVGGWVMIKANKLEYNVIGKALEKGEFYASNGPDINSLWFEDGKVHVECTPAVTVNCIFGVKVAKRVPARDGQLVTEAEFEIKPNHKWFRIHVEDEHGRFADSRAFFMDEFEFPPEPKKN